MKLAELEDELRLLFEERAADVVGPRPAAPRHVVDAGTIAHTTEVVREERRRPLLAIAAAVGVIALVATAVVALRPADEQLIPAGTPGPLFVLPAADGPAITSARMSSSFDYAADPGARLVLVGRPERDGVLTHLVQFGFPSRPTEREVERGTVELRFADVELTAQIGDGFTEPHYEGVLDGNTVTIRTQLDLPTLRDVIADVELDGAGVRFADGSNLVTAATYVEPEEPVFGVELVLEPEVEGQIDVGWIVYTAEHPSESLLSNAFWYDRAEPVEVRGRQGWLLSSDEHPGALQWSETDRHALTVAGPTDVDGLIELAEGLRFVGPTEWLAATDPLIDLGGSPAATQFLLPNEDSDIAVRAAEANEVGEVLWSALTQATFGREDGGDVVDLVTVSVSDDEPSNGEVVSIDLANRSFEFRSLSPVPVASTLLEADLGDLLLRVSSSLPVEELRSVLAEVEIVDDERARLAEGSRFVTVRSTDTPAELLVVGGTYVELDTPQGRVVLETLVGGVDPAATMGALSSELRLIAVRGVPAWASTSDEKIGIGWRESDQQTVFMSGDDGITVDDLLQVAHELDVVDQDVWLTVAE